jgi:hypothetical protein
MLDVLLRALGLDIDARLQQVRTVAEDFKHRALEDVRYHAAEAGTIGGLVLFGLAALGATFAMALVALYVWVANRHDTYVALAAVGCVTLLTAAICFSIASARARRKPPQRPPVEMPKSAASPLPRIADTVTAMVPPPPANADVVDVVFHRFTSRAASAADDAIAQATATVSKGSRGALLATIAATMALGFVAGRRQAR